MAPGLMAGDEDEIRLGRRLFGDRAALVEGQQPAVKALAHFHAAAGIGAVLRAGRDIQAAPGHLHGVIAGDDARVAAAQEVRQIAGRPAPDWRGVGRGPGEAAVVVGEELGQIGRGRGHRREAAQAELGDEAVLQGLPQPLDPALGLRRAGRDEGDAEVAEDLAEVRGVLLAAELFLEAPVRVVADKDGEAIAVEGEGQAIGVGQVPQQREVAVEVLGRPEVEAQDDAVASSMAPSSSPRVPVLSQSNSLPSSKTRAPIRAAGVRRARCWRGRRRRFAGRPRARRIRRTELRLRARPSSSWSFSVR
jgi:hypothetical protein